MSVESKIKQLLEQVNAKASLEEADAMSPSSPKDSSIKAAVSGDASMPKQGGSQDAQAEEERDEKEENQGAIAAKSIKQNTLTAKGPGATPNFQTVGDATSAVNQPNSAGNTPVGEEFELDEGTMDNQSLSSLWHQHANHSYHADQGHGIGGGSMKNASNAATAIEKHVRKKHGNTVANDMVDHSRLHVTHAEYAGPGESEEIEKDAAKLRTKHKIKGDIIGEESGIIDLSPIFGDDLSEDFKAKATSIFEAAVIARVNSEMDKVATSLEEKYAADVAEYKDGIVEKIDSYLNYVVENWMKENELALENGLRTEIAEDFMTGLKVLFKEHYVEVPEEKYDVIGELQAKAEELADKLDEAIGHSVELNKEVTSLKRAAIIEELSKDLADTEAAKLGKLLEGVDFENEDLYREKVSVIRDNYFPKNVVTEGKVSVQSQQTLTEDNDVPTEISEGTSVVNVYAQALSRSIKRA
jgi:hypothetical protein